jgi:hypothetical protein
MLDATSTVKSVVTGSINLFRKANHVVSSAVMKTEPVRLDPALLSAEQIEEKMFQLYDILGEFYPTVGCEVPPELLFCSEQMKKLRENIGDFESKHSMNARSILGEAIDIVGIITRMPKASPDTSTDDNDHQTQMERWQKSVQSLIDQATKLRAFAAAQPGSGFGDRVNSDGDGSDLAGKDSGFNKVLRSRQHRLQIMRTAAKDAQDTLLKARDMQLATQAKIIELTKDIEALDHQKATLKQTKDVLLKAIDAIKSMHMQISNLTSFFSVLSHIISIVGIGHGRRYLENIGQGIRKSAIENGNEQQLTVEYNEYQKQVIRETMILLRGYFGFVAHSTELYQQISREHILPCIREAATLPLSATRAEQDIAKAHLLERANASAEAIRDLAQREYDAFHGSLEARVKEIDDDLKKMPALQYDNRKAIEEGVRESNAETREYISEAYEEIDDAI